MAVIGEKSLQFFKNAYLRELHTADCSCSFCHDLDDFPHFEFWSPAAEYYKTGWWTLAKRLADGTARYWRVILGFKR